MKSIVLISCSKSKSSQRSPAQDLYTSPLFRMSLAYSKTLNPDHIYILSALHGLLSLEKKVSPYNKTLNNATPSVNDINY